MWWVFQQVVNLQIEYMHSYWEWCSMAAVLFAGVGDSGSYRLSEGGHHLNWYREKWGLRGRKLSLSATILAWFLTHKLSSLASRKHSAIERDDIIMTWLPASWRHADHHSEKHQFNSHSHPAAAAAAHNQACAVRVDRSTLRSALSYQLPGSSHRTWDCPSCRADTLLQPQEVMCSSTALPAGEAAARPAPAALGVGRGRGRFFIIQKKKKKKEVKKKEQVYCKNSVFRVFPETSRYITNKSVNPALSALAPAGPAQLRCPAGAGTETCCEVSDKQRIWAVLETVVKKNNNNNNTVEPRKSAERRASTHTQNLEALFHFQAEL